MRSPSDNTVPALTHSNRRPVTLAQLRERPTVTVQMAGAVLGIERTAAYAAVRRGDIPSLKIGRRVVVPTVPLLRMLGADQPLTGGEPELKDFP